MRTRHRGRWLRLVAALLVLPALGLPGGSRAQGAIPGSGSRTFAETGQAVTGIFLTYWDAHGGLAQQGFPISPLLEEVSDLDQQPYQVQYFERAVFEYHPENAGTPYEVLLSQLGTYRYQAKYGAGGAAGQRPNQAAGNSRFFAETGHRVGGKFWDYWQQHGGLAQQGYPISDEFTEASELDPGTSYTVQYFERAVFELHPENAGTPYEVLLTQLGTYRHRAKYQATAEPPIEGRFDVGGYQLWLRCTGQGRPTVIMEAGLGTPSSTWSLVEPDAAKLTRTCVYDRANVGRSDRGPRPRTSGQIVQELHTLLQTAKVGGPYVLVGHSQGGLHAQLYAGRYPTDTVGLVLVDSVHPEWDQRLDALLTPAQREERWRLTEQNGESATEAELKESHAQARAAGPLPAVPLVVLAHGADLQHPPGWPVAAIEQAWRATQEDLANRTPQGKLVVAAGIGHFIHRDAPQLVRDAVREVVTAARQR